MNRLTLDQIEPGMAVRYVPLHAHGKLSHPDVEDGIVSSKNDQSVFVKFNKWGGETSQSCRPEDLVRG